MFYRIESGKKTYQILLVLVEAVSKLAEVLLICPHRRYERSTNLIRSIKYYLTQVFYMGLTEYHMFL